MNEYSLLNDSDNDIKDIFLLGLPLMLRLEVIDDAERRLVFLPNAIVKQIVEPLVADKSNPLNVRIAKIMEPGPPYFLWIKLPEDAKFAPGDSKIIRLKYQEKEEPKTPSITVTPYSVERHKVLFNRTGQEDYDVFILINGPAGYRIEYEAKAKSNGKQLGEKDGFYQNRTDEFAQIRIPNNNQEVACEIFYDIFPPKSERNFFKGTILAMYIISGFLVFLVLITRSDETYNSINLAFHSSTMQSWNLPELRSLFGGVLNRLFEIVGGIVGLSVAIAGLIRDPLFGRARWFYLGTAALAAAAFILQT